MLGDKEVYPTIAVKDMATAKQFYGGTLGLSAIGDMEGMALYNVGPGKLLVYESEFAGSNKATYANWDVDNIESVVEALQKANVKFEQYDNLPGAASDMTRDGVIHKTGNMKAAWFRDPDGNILALTALES